MLLESEDPENWIIANQKKAHVRNFVRMNFVEVGIELEYKGERVDEKKFVKSYCNTEYQIEIGKEVLSINPKYSDLPKLI
jgi:GDPmannose 4,6-dehydratase